MQRALNFQ